MVLESSVIEIERETYRKMQNKIVFRYYGTTLLKNNSFYSIVMSQSVLDSRKNHVVTAPMLLVKLFPQLRIQQSMTEIL